VFVRHNCMRQKAQLLQRNRATPYISWNLVTCCTSRGESEMEELVSEWGWRRDKRSTSRISWSCDKSRLLSSSVTHMRRYLLRWMAAFSGKCSVTVWHPSVRPSVCYLFLTLIERSAHTQRDSPGGSTRRGQHTFPFEIMRTNVLVYCRLLMCPWFSKSTSFTYSLL